MFFEDTIAEVGKFMDSGGPVLWAIVVLLFVMWTLIFERLWYLRSSVPMMFRQLSTRGKRAKRENLSTLTRLEKR